MAEKKPVKKPARVSRAKKAPPAAAKPAAKRVAAPQKKPAGDVPDALKRRTVVGPQARTCPLVLDGEVAASDFSEKDCLTCGEFDCKFCESRNGSGGLRSRLFAGAEDGDEDGDEGWDLDFGEGEESVGGDEDEGEDEEEI